MWAMTLVAIAFSWLVIGIAVIVGMALRGQDMEDVVNTGFFFIVTWGLLSMTAAFMGIAEKHYARYGALVHDFAQTLV